MPARFHEQMPMNKRPAVSPEDLELFRSAVRDTEPLTGDPRADPYRRRPRLNRSKRQARPTLEEGFTELLSESEIETEAFLEFARPGVQKRLFADLRRGRIEVERSLDLHGLTISYAAATLADFLADCHRQRIRCVHIVHGKGRGSEDRQPILKHQLNVWLRQRSDVMAFCSCQPRDGGTGAVYALLRPLRGTR